MRQYTKGLLIEDFVVDEERYGKHSNTQQNIKINMDRHPYKDGEFIY